jgi:hypothetical protein
MTAPIHTQETSKKSSTKESKTSFFSKGKNSDAFFQPVVQTKLTVNKPGDSFEQEADAMADKVMRKPAAAPAKKCPSCKEKEEAQTTAVKEKHATDDTPVQRKCSHCEEEEKKKLTVQRKSEDSDNVQVSNTLAKDIESHKGKGSPLPQDTKTFMEDGFGAGFDNVRVHHGSYAAEMTSGVNAQAFTVGKDIYFNSGKYNPASHSGKHLLAHELTHVLQQGNGVQRKCSECEKEEKVQRKTEDEESLLQRKEIVQRKCSECEKEEKVQRKTEDEESLLQRKETVVQRKPADEPKKYAGEINYDEAGNANMESWYNLYKFFNLFREESIFPGTPVAYANHVFELQKQLIAIPEAAWKGTPDGILPSNSHASTAFLSALVNVAISKSKAPEKDVGIDAAKLTRLVTLVNGFESDAPPLQSDLRGSFQLGLVNKNAQFNIHVDDRGDYVKLIQEALLKLNYDIGSDYKTPKGKTEKEVTGVFGKGTKTALENFQRESGFTGKQVDGILGQDTLRVLDKRMATAIKATQIAVGAGGNVAFSIPVDKSMLTQDPETLKKDLLLKSLTIIFPISDIQANNLINAHWHWEKYNNVTLEEVTAGFKKVSIPRTSYESIMGKIENPTNNAKDAEPLEDKLTTEVQDMSSLSGLYQLTKEIAALEKKLIQESVNCNRMEKDVCEKTDTIKLLRQKKDELAALLKEKNLTEEAFNEKKGNFLKHFESMAVQTAFQILGQNEVDANVEFLHYTKETEVAKLKDNMAELSKDYADADLYLVQGICFHTHENNINKYKSTEEYIDNNETYSEFGSDRAGLEWMVKKFCTDSLAKRSDSNPYFGNYYDAEVAIVKKLQGKVSVSPILAYPKLELRENAGKYAAMSIADLQSLVQHSIKDGDDGGIKGSIARTRERLRDKPEMVWEMPPVIELTKLRLNILPNTGPDQMIMDAWEDRKRTDFWKSIGFAAVALGVGLLALASGPVGWFALGASIALGTYDAYNTYQGIKEKRDAYDTALEPARALGTENPTYFWFAVSLVALGIDVGMAVKVVKNVTSAINMAKEVAAGLKAEISTVEDSLKLVKQGGKEAERLKSQIRRLEEAIDKIKTGDYIQHVELLKPLRGDPHAMRFMLDALQEPETLKAVTGLVKLVSKETASMAIQFYAGIGKRTLPELPELVRLIEKGGLKAQPALLEALFSDVRVQKVLLDTGRPEMMLAEFGKWSSSLKGEKAVSFLEHLASLGFETKFKKGLSLTEHFGAGFSKLPQGVRNRQILRMVEPRLLDAMNAGTLPPEMAHALEVLLEREVIGMTTDLARAQERMLRELGVVAEGIDLQSDYVKLMGLIDNPLSKKVVSGSAVNIFGREPYMKLLQKIDAETKIPADVWEDLMKIGPMTDEGTVKRLIADIPFRKALLEDPTVIQALKKCASPCFPPAATVEQVRELSRILKNKSPEELAKIREFIYQNRSDTKKLDDAIKQLNTTYDQVIKDIKTPLLDIPQKFKKVEAIEANLKQIVGFGVPVEQLNKIMKNFVQLEFGNSADFIYLMRKMLELEKNVPMKNMGKILAGLESTNKNICRAAEHLMDEIARFPGAKGAEKKLFTYPGLQKADKLLDIYELADLRDIMRARWTDGFINSLFEVQGKIKGSAADITALIKKTGSDGVGDLERLRRILERLKGDGVTVEEALAAIKESDEFAANLSSAMLDPKKGFDAIAKQLWGKGATIKDGVIEVAPEMAKGKKGAGEAAIKQIMGANGELAGELAEKFIVAGDKINYANWGVVRSVILKAENVADGIKSNMIGELWNRINLVELRKAGFDDITREVELIIGGGTARADAVAIKGQELIVFEFKSMKGELTADQKIVYPFLEAGNFAGVKVNNERLAKLFKDLKMKRSFRLVEEKDFLK